MWRKQEYHLKLPPPLAINKFKIIIMKNLKLTLAKDVLKKDYKLFFVDIKSGEARLNKTQK